MFLSMVSSVLYQVPRHTVVEPVPEVVESMLNQVLCCSEVEPRIELVNNAFEPYHREKSTGNGCSCNGAKDKQTEQTTSVAACFTLEEHVSWRRFGCHDEEEAAKGGR